MKETPTRELDAPRTEIGKDLHVEQIGKTYKIIRKDIEDWWAELDPDADDGPPLLLQDKHRDPFNRNF